jgi:hypothetical protein
MTSDSTKVTIELITTKLLIMKIILVIGVGSISVITEKRDKLLLMSDIEIEKLPNTSMITNTSYLNISVLKLVISHTNKMVGTVGSKKPLSVLVNHVGLKITSKTSTVLSQLMLLILLIHYLSDLINQVVELNVVIMVCLNHVSHHHQNGKDLLKLKLNGHQSTLLI